MYYIQKYDESTVEINENKLIPLFIKTNKTLINMPLIFNSHNEMIKYIDNYEKR